MVENPQSPISVFVMPNVKTVGISNIFKICTKSRAMQLTAKSRGDWKVIHSGEMYLCQKNTNVLIHSFDYCYIHKVTKVELEFRWCFQSALFALNPENHREESRTVENLSGWIYPANQHSYWPFGIIYNKLTDTHPIATLKEPSINWALLLLHH